MNNRVLNVIFCHNRVLNFIFCHNRELNVIFYCTAKFGLMASRCLVAPSNAAYASKLSSSESQSELEASDGIRKSPRGDSETEPTFGGRTPSANERWSPDCKLPGQCLCQTLAQQDAKPSTDRFHGEAHGTGRSHAARKGQPGPPSSAQWNRQPQLAATLEKPVCPKHRAEREQSRLRPALHTSRHSNQQGT